MASVIRNFSYVPHHIFVGGAPVEIPNIVPQGSTTPAISPDLPPVVSHTPGVESKTDEVIDYGKSYLGDPILILDGQRVPLSQVGKSDTTVLWIIGGIFLAAYLLKTK